MNNVTITFEIEAIRVNIDLIRNKDAVIAFQSPLDITAY